MGTPVFGCTISGHNGTYGGREHGTTAIHRANGTTTVLGGPAGTWLLFRNPSLIHRDIPPDSASRIAGESTLVPPLRRSAAPDFPDLNATCPKYPWSLHPLVRHLRSRKVGPVARRTDSSSSAGAPPDAKAARAAEKARRGVEKVAAAAEKRAHAARELARRRRRQRLLAVLNRIVPPTAINIGGGSEFAHFRWRNLDATVGPANPSPFSFHPDCEFPLRDGSVTTVYTSHCLEHLDDATVARVLSEAHRVLSGGGRLVVKIPDFDRALTCWRAGDESFFDPDRWGLRRLMPIWERRGVAGTLDNRASMVFCGFWNDEYGNHFGERKAHDDAYHGPAVIDSGTLRQLISAASPHAIAAALRTHVIEQETSYHFNHQNAWSRSELRHLLERHGFDVTSFEADDVIAAGANIPGITNSRTESLYCLARVRRS